MILKAAPKLRELQLGNGLNLLQFSCTRSTAGNATAADRQLRLAKWLVGDGFDPLASDTSTRSRHRTRIRLAATAGRNR